MLCGTRRHHRITVAAKKNRHRGATQTNPLVVISDGWPSTGKAGIGGDPACIKDYTGGKRRVKEFAGKESRSVGSG
jgi:hypothetical protein